MLGRFDESSSKGKGSESVTLQREEGSKRQERFQHQTEGGDSVEKQAEYEAYEQGSDHQQDETCRPTPAASGPTGDSSYEASNRDSDLPRSPPATIKPRKATSRNFEHEKSPEEQAWESHTAVIAHNRITQKSKALKGLRLHPPQPLNGDDNK